MTSGDGTAVEGDLDINQLSEVSGHTVRNIRAYLQMDLLHTGKKAGRNLIFDRSHVLRLAQVDQFRARGYSLAAIQDIISGRGDAMVADDVAAIGLLVSRWLEDDDHLWTTDELERLLPDVVDRPSLLEETTSAGIGRVVADGVVITRPELFRVGLDLARLGMSVPDALKELESLERVIGPVVDHLVAVYHARLDTAVAVDDPHAALDELWPSVMLTLGSIVTRRVYQRVADDAAARDA